MSAQCLVVWPSAPLTDRLVRNALDALNRPITIIASPPQPSPNLPLIQWASYDHIDHELTHQNRQKVLASSYIFRKALIRKHFLSRTLTSYIIKHPSSLLKTAVPKTYEIEISFADELDEMWADDLWELGECLESSQSWWILKPGMSDRGMGIRLFNSKETLQEIFEEFELSDDEDENSADNISETAVVTSQLRHFVIQEYVPNPLLLDPFEIPINGLPIPSQLHGRKFHLRAYCVASGSLQIFLYDRILALFSATAYADPIDTATQDLTPHLTNTSLQTHKGEEGVRLLNELTGCHILSSKGNVASTIFSSEDIAEIIKQMVDVLAETFQAALANPVHFQPLPNAFELFGIDFLVAHSQAPGDARLQIKLLEINSEPAIELTGPRLTWILEELFVSIAKVCVEPFLMDEEEKLVWETGQTRHNLIKVLDERRDR